MTRYIDVDICIEKIKNLSIEYDAETVQRCIEVLSNAPTVDVSTVDISTIDAEPVRHRFEKSDAGMTVSEYRERMIQAFHNADCDSLISVVVLPIEKEFQFLEWLLKNEYIPFLEKTDKALKAQQWIPCSERLPKMKEIVLITNDKGHVRCGRYRGVGFFSKNDGRPHWNWKGNTLETVVAWMPLPEPYKGDKE